MWKADGKTSEAVTDNEVHAAGDFHIEETAFPETTGFFKGKVRKSLEGKIEQAEKQEKRIHTDMEQTVKQAGYPDVQSFAKTYQKSEKLVREYNEELRAWENQTEQKKEQSSEPPKKASIREKLHRYQQENIQQPKQSAKKKSMNRER